MKPLLQATAALLIFAPSAFGVLPDRCVEAVRPPYVAKLIKTRDDGTEIFELKAIDGKTYFYKENFVSGKGERGIFDDLGMAALAVTFARKTGLEKFLPETNWRSGVAIKIGEKQITTRPGVLQAGIPEVSTPIDDLKRLHPSVEVHAKALHPILNNGDWPRLYADWKIFWSIFQQVDLNIANLARSGSNIVIFDLGDVLNLPDTRKKMGIRSAKDEASFAMPGNPTDRAEHRPDFRAADPEFKEFVRIVANASDEELAKSLGKELDESFIGPRGKVRDHVRIMRTEALRIQALLTKPPFD